MSLMRIFATVGLIWILAMMSHLFGALLFAPGTEIYGLATPAVGTFIDANWQDDMYMIFAQFIPLLFVGCSLVWSLAKVYEDALHSGGY